MLRRSIGSAAIAVLAWTNVGFAQDGCAFGVCINNNRPDDSVVSAGARAPGGMVNAGVARTLLNTRAAQSRIEITEPAPVETNVGQEFLIDAIDVVFDQVNELIVYFTNLLLERAGLEPVPVDDDSGGRPPKPGTR